MNLFSSIATHILTYKIEKKDTFTFVFNLCWVLKFSLISGHPDVVFKGTLAVNRLTHECLRIPPSIVVWICDTFENNFGIDNDFTKYLRESCW